MKPLGFWTIHDRHMLVGPISFLLLAWFAYGYYYLNNIPTTGPGRFLKLPFYPVIWTFALADLLYNWTIGSFLFWEKPQSAFGLFTGRLEKWKFMEITDKTTEAELDKHEFAIYICELLGRHDENHCHQ